MLTELCEFRGGVRSLLQLTMEYKIMQCLQLVYLVENKKKQFLDSVPAFRHICTLLYENAKDFCLKTLHRYYLSHITIFTINVYLITISVISTRFIRESSVSVSPLSSVNVTPDTSQMAEIHSLSTEGL